MCTSDRIITGYMGKAHSKAYTVWGCRPGDDPNSGDTSLYCQPTHQQLIQIDYIPLEIIDNIPRIDLIIDRLLALQVFL